MVFSSDQLAEIGIQYIQQTPPCDQYDVNLRPGAYDINGIAAYGG